MAVLDFLFGGQSLSPVNESSMWVRLFGSSESRSGQTITAETAMRVTAVFACVRVLAEGVAMLPLHTYERLPNGKRLAPAHPLSLLMRKPNKWQTRFEWIEMMQGHVALRGNAYSEILAGSIGAASELVPLHPDRMRVEMRDNGELLYLYRDLNGYERRLSQQQVFHLRGLSSDGITGINPIQAAREAIGVALAAEGHEASTMRNGGKLGVVLETDQVMKADAAKMLLENWEARHGGADNGGRTALLTNGLKAHEIGMSNDDAQFIELRQFQIAEIARIFRVPLHMIGDLTRSTNNNIEHQSLEFLIYTLSPWLVRWEQAIQRDLILEAEEDDSNKFYCKFNVDAIARGDMAARSSFYREMVNAGIYTINEIRELEDMNPTGDNADEQLVQGAMTTLDRIVNPPPPPAPIAPFGAKPAGEEKPDEEEDPDLAAAIAERDQLRSDVLILGTRLGVTEARADAAQQQSRMTAERLHDSQGHLADRTAELAAERQRVKQAEEESAIQSALVAERQAELDKLSAEHELADRGNEAASAAARLLVKETFERFGRLERDAVERAARKSNFIEALEQFYPAHEKRLADALRIPVDILFLLTRVPCSAEHVANTHCAAHKLALLEMSGECLPAQLLDSVDALMDGWQSPDLGEIGTAEKQSRTIKTIVRDDDGLPFQVVEDYQNGERVIKTLVRGKDGSPFQVVEERV